MNDPMQTAPGANRGRQKSNAGRRDTPQDTSPSLFDQDIDDGDTRRERGMVAATHASHPWVKTATDAAIKRWALRRVPFVADNIRSEVEQLASSPNLLGARINAAARRGLIRKTGNYRKSRTASRHGGVVAEWIGTGTEVER